MKDRDDVAPDNEDDDNFGLQDVVEDLHSKFQSDFVKLMEPLKDVKKMGREYRGILLKHCSITASKLRIKAVIL